MKKFTQVSYLFLLCVLITTQFTFAQSPGNVGTTNLTAWFNLESVSLGAATSWSTLYPTGAAAITLTDAVAPFPTVTNTPAANISNYNKTINFDGNTIAAPMSLEFAGTLNILNNAVTTNQGTLFAVYFMKPSSPLAAQQVVDYRESNGDAIQLRWLTATTSRLAIGTSNSVNATRDYPEGSLPMILSYSGNRSSATSLKCRKKSLEWTNNPVSSSASTSAQLGLTIGTRKTTAGVYSGVNQSYISELIFFNTDLNLNDNIKVESYLGIKYGITLDATGLSGGVYFASNSTNYWYPTGALPYHNQVIGIGNDADTKLNQKQSHTFDDSLRLYLGTLEPSNDNNSSLFNNNISYLMIGNNLGANNETALATAEMPTGLNLISRIEREWRVTNTNLSDVYNVDITLNSFTNFTINPAELCLLVDDDDNFSNATVFQSGLTFNVNANTISVTGINNSQIPMNSTKYITLAYINNSGGLPTAGITTSNALSVCEGSPFNLSLIGASSFSGQSYQWESSPNNITYTPIIGATNATYSPSPTSTTFYHCIVSLGINISISSNLMITVNPLPIVTATANPNTTICSGQNISLLGSGATSYTWNSIPTLTSDTILTPAVAGTYTVVGTDGLGCFASSTITIVVNPLPSVGTSVTSASICVGNTTTITGTGATTYTWEPGTLSGPSITVSPSSTTTYTVTGIASNGCSNIGATIITVTPCGSTLNLKLFIEGYYIGAGFMAPVMQNEGVALATSTQVDSITVELRNASAPYALVNSIQTILNTDGTCTCVFTVTGSYYLVVKHRNGVATWSANPIPISVTPSTYDFSTAANQAYGNNQASLSASDFGIYSGDFNTDENVDLLDLSLIENDIAGFLFGYFATDLNGDGNVDLLDSSILEANINLFIFSNHP